MSSWMIEMRVRVRVDADSSEELKDAERDLAERVVDVDPHPRFVTAVPWMFDDADRLPVPFVEAAKVANGNLPVARRGYKGLGSPPS